jgi:hypothetical protein
MMAKLTPAQWMALRFFARQPGLPELSDSAEFQATIDGIGSQVNKALEAGGSLIGSDSRRTGRESLSSPSDLLKGHSIDLRRQ